MKGSKLGQILCADKTRSQFNYLTLPVDYGNVNL